MNDVAKVQNGLNGLFKAEGSVIKDIAGVCGLMENAEMGGLNGRALTCRLDGSELKDLVDGFGGSLEGLRWSEMKLEVSHGAEVMSLTVDLMYEKEGMMVSIPVDKDESAMLWSAYVSACRKKKDAEAAA